MLEEGKFRPKIVIDTNVYVSGLNFKGKPRDILDMIWKKEIEVYISLFILKELEDTLEKDFGWDKEAIKDVIERIKVKTNQVQTSTRISVIRGKDEDNRILECAITAKAQYIVSGDKKHLLSLGEYQGIKIISPADFLNLFYNYYQSLI
jgi:putative PIN family toxin of toxin-antitoxin system